MTEQELQTMVTDKYTKICICKSINKAAMKRIIKDGATTLQAVRYKTGAGSGACQGRRCTPRIEALLESYHAGEL